MRPKKREIPVSRREMNVQEGGGVKERGDLTCMHKKFFDFHSSMKLFM